VVNGVANNQFLNPLDGSVFSLTWQSEGRDRLVFLLT
jgi:hypothetical protein